MLLWECKTRSATRFIAGLAGGVLETETAQVGEINQDMLAGWAQAAADLAAIRAMSGDAFAVMAADAHVDGRIGPARNDQDRGYDAAMLAAVGAL